MSPKPWPPIVSGRWRGAHRLIRATYADSSGPFLADLLGPDSDDAELRAITELAAATNTRLLAQADGAGLALGGYELVYDLDHSAVINAAFAYPGLGGRFHDQTRGAWYAALRVRTALAEVIHHATLALAEIDYWHDRVDYQDYMCDLGGDHFADLRGQERRTLACRDPESYKAGQALGLRLVEDGHAGVVWPSVRDKGGTCVACFRPALLPPVWRGGRWSVEWSGTPKPKVTPAPI